MTGRRCVTPLGQQQAPPPPKATGERSRVNYLEADSTRSTTLGVHQWFPDPPRGRSTAGCEPALKGGRSMFAALRLVNRRSRRSESGPFEFRCPDRAVRRAVPGRETTLSGARRTGDPTNPTGNMSGSCPRRNPN
jgi:hypothetical protein